MKKENKKAAKRDSKRDRKKEKKICWKEYIYNSPYLIAVCVTSAVVMCCSDEIGIHAIAKDAKIFAYEAYAQMPAKQGQTVSGSVSGDTQEEIADLPAADALQVPGAEEGVLQASGAEEDAPQASGTGNSQEESENAGACRDENNGLMNSGVLPEDDRGQENAEKIEERPVGITKYEYYEPVQIDSRYYKDAGKIALTTEYPYALENDSYFNDAAFLGDSRTLGISDYAGLDAADFYCDSGMTIFKLLEEGITYQKTGSKVDLKSVLQEKKYGKIYIMLGMNELGYGDTAFYLDQYREVLQQIREWQPEAIIYIMANLHVSREKNNPESEFNNININDKNAASASLANGTDVFYLDVNPFFADEEGFLKAELTFDGVHLYAKHYAAWKDFLLEHAVEPEKAQPDGAAEEH